MSEAKKKLTVSGLHWTLGVVVLIESLKLALTREEDHFFATNAFLHHVRPVLAWSEAVAAIVFLVPYTTLFGGWLLLAVFAFAMVIHVLHGQMDVGLLLVYGMAVILVMTHGEEKA